MKYQSIILLLLSVSLTTSQKPDLVVEIFRHGIRTPEATEFDSTWTNIGYGELTGLGMRQQYILGAALAQLYPDNLIPYDAAKIYVQATQENRTIVSAISQLYGIYQGLGPNLDDGYPAERAVPPYNSTDVDNVLKTLTAINAAIPGNYQPVPIHSYPRPGDYLLEGYLNCPNANKFFYAQQNDANVTAVYTAMNQTITNLKQAGFAINGPSDLDDLGDTVMADYFNQISPLPGNIDPKSVDFYNLVFFTQWYEIYPVLNLAVQKQWFSGPFLYNLLDNIYAVQNDSSSLQFVLYAAKETMLSTILAALNITTPECYRANWESYIANQTKPFPQCDYPTFASSLIFEYYNSTSEIVVLYNGATVNVCNGQPSCSLTDFQALVKNVTAGTDLNTFFSVCGVNPSAAAEAYVKVTPAATSFETLDYLLIGLITLLSASLFVIIRKATGKQAPETYAYKRIEVFA